MRRLGGPGGCNERAQVSEVRRVLQSVLERHLSPLRVRLQDGIRRPQAAVPPVELTTYRVKARLIEVKLEDDQDIHLVIAEVKRPALTMIVEFPASACTRGAARKRRHQMAKARATFIRRCGRPSSNSFEPLAE